MVEDQVTLCPNFISLSSRYLQKILAIRARVCGDIFRGIHLQVRSDGYGTTAIVGAGPRIELKLINYKKKRTDNQKRNSRECVSPLRTKPLLGSTKKKKAEADRDGNYDLCYFNDVI